ncbi:MULTISPECIES: M48 family metallopeptidase [unclassified Undibacterium]|uniref:M48 family metallopeptidase n=2 Tax=Undibacterium TaxID=401469 RepID=UPI002B239E1F|nr:MULTISPECIES: M48 family metallopeptidase [unclassified Undibacterium]
MMPVAANYFDGRTSRAHHVYLEVVGQIAQLTGDVQLECPLDQLRVSERTSNKVRKVTFPDGAYLEVSDPEMLAALANLLSATGHSDSLIVRMQQSWRATLIAVVSTVVLISLLYVYALPAAAKIVAFALPEKVERALGDGALTFLDEHFFSPTKLSVERQNELSTRFARLRPVEDDSPAYRLLFRKSKIGPNALALPSGEIILTDELVNLSHNDDAIMGVLAHELGHLHERHLSRRVIQSSAVAAVAVALFGDVSTAVASLPPLLLDLKYSRDAEREADAYALAMLEKNGISSNALADLFADLEKNHSASNPYLSSHPSSAERIMFLRKGDQDGSRLNKAAQ